METLPGVGVPGKEHSLQPVSPPVHPNPSFFLHICQVPVIVIPAYYTPVDPGYATILYEYWAPGRMLYFCLNNIDSVYGLWNTYSNNRPLFSKLKRELVPPFLCQCSLEHCFFCLLLSLFRHFLQPPSLHEKFPCEDDFHLRIYLAIFLRFQILFLVREWTLVIS